MEKVAAEDVIWQRLETRRGAMTARTLAAAVAVGVALFVLRLYSARRGDNRNISQLYLVKARANTPGWKLRFCLISACAELK